MWLLKKNLLKVAHEAGGLGGHGGQMIQVVLLAKEDVGKITIPMTSAIATWNVSNIIIVVKILKKSVP